MTTSAGVRDVRVAFSVREDIEYLSDLMPNATTTDKHLLLELALITYVSAFVMLFPYSTVYCGRMGLVSLKLAEVLSNSCIARLSDFISRRGHTIVDDHLLEDNIKRSASAVFETTCDKLHNLFDPYNTQVFTTGIDQDYIININPSECGRIIKATLNDPNTVRRSPQKSQLVY